VIDKQVGSHEEAVDGIDDGATVMVSGFGGAGIPYCLLDALVARRPRDVTLVANSPGVGDSGVPALLGAGIVRKIICCFPHRESAGVFDRLYASGEIELELVPQGTLCERIRASAAGLGGFYTPVAVGTPLAEGRETRELGGRRHVLELPIRADFALIRAYRADRWGNLVYRAAGRNYGPVMAGAAAVTVAEVDEVVPLGDIDPEHVVTPGIFVDRVVAA
jgi:3-oxoadipate CoA-transferase, alpha subunit